MDATRPTPRDTGPLISLTTDERSRCAQIGADRMRGGNHRPPADGNDPLRVEIIGTMAEWAVCRHYGLDPNEWVKAYDHRTGPIPDLMHRGFRVSVKGRVRWHTPLDMIVEEHDTENDIYILVSVNPDSGQCALRGWITRDDMLRYPSEGWKWTTDRPGAYRDHKRRYIPVEDLRPCRRG